MGTPCKVAIVGGGWAGMAAAVAANRAGHKVTVFESSRSLGGRARALAANLPDGTPVVLDNGQHILIGAYSDTLALMRAVGVDIEKSLLRLPLAMQFPDGQGLSMRHLPSPIDALWAMLTLRGWSAYDKWSLLRSALLWQFRGFRCSSDTTVSELCHSLTPRAMETLIDPLCVSALNTPAERASGQVFLTVLRDSLFGDQGGSNLLLPMVDLSNLFPQTAARWLSQHGGALRLGTRIDALHFGPASDTDSSPGDAPETHRWELNGEPFDAVIWATGSAVAAQTLAASAPNCPAPVAFALTAWADRAQALEFEAIATVYAYAPGARLPQPMLALYSHADAPAQFVFDRGQLGGPVGLLAFVVSASRDARDVLQDLVLAQGQTQLQAFLGGNILCPLQTVVEKRATFACTPGLKRPVQTIAPGLLACGDYTDGPYPATLEGAVRSGVFAARKIDGACAAGNAV